MKLAMCLFKYFPYGGLSRDFMRILRESQNRGHEIDVFTSEWDGPHPVDITVHELKSLRRTNHARNAAFYRKLKVRLATAEYDAVIGFNKMPGLDIYYGADYCYVGRVSPKYPQLYRLTSRYRHMANFEEAVFGHTSETLILSLSENERNVYRQYYATADRRFHIMPPTLDRERKPGLDRDLVRKQMRAELDVEDQQRLILFIGSGFKTKGLDRAIDAIAALDDELRPQTRLLVIGEDDSGSFKRRARKLGIANQVSFMGGRDDIPELLTAGDLLLHPAYHENTGTVLLEAIASGLAVLATDVCGYASHIERADAGLVLKSPFSQHALNTNLKNILQSPRLDQWRTNGLRYGANPELYTMPENAVDRVENWVDENPTRSRDRVAVPNSGHPNRLYVREDLRKTLGDDASIESIMELEGESFRVAPGRRTIRFRRAENSFFLKAHTGVGWFEIIKNFCYGRMPVIGADNEWHGIHWIKRHGIDTLTVAAYGTGSGNPARRHSFIVTDEIDNAISLEDYLVGPARARFNSSDEIAFKRQLVKKVATVAKAMHESGANHRDFYLCHFLMPTRQQLDVDPSIHLIDLHRMQLRRTTPKRWIIKDIAGLYYSSMNADLSRRDFYRFIRAYRGRPLKQIFAREANFWTQVEQKAQALYQAEARRAQRLVDVDADKSTEPN